MILTNKSSRQELTKTQGTDQHVLTLPFHEEHIKQIIAVKISQIIRERNMTQMQASKLAGIAQPRLSRLINGKLKGVSFEMMLRILIELGAGIEIVIELPSLSNPKNQTSSNGQNSVI